MKVIAIIPTLNESQGVAQVIKGFKQAGVREIIVADGGSSDNTRQIAKKSGAKVIAVPRGKGSGFRTLLEKIKLEDKKIYLMIDGDASYESKEAPKLLKELAKFDVVSGKRKLLIHDVKSAVHVVGNTLISMLGSLIFFHWNPDICTGYWAFKGSALKKLRQKLNAKNFELEADLFSNIAKMGLRHKAVKVSYVKRKGDSKLRVTDAFLILKKLVANRFQ